MAKYKVTAPVADYAGTVGKVKFANGSAEIDEDANPAELSYCRNAGYLVEAAEEVEPAKVPEPDGPYDPAAHGMPEVLTYLADADEAEAERVLDAEAAGKNRKGIVDQRDAILARARENDASKENDQ